MLNQNQILKTVQTASTISPTVEVLTNQEKQLVKITGTLTSNLHSRKSTETPYYAFFRTDDNRKHSLIECIKSKCQDCDIPIIFRIKERKICQFHARCSQDCRYQQALWKNSNLNKGQRLLLQGNWAKSDHRSRLSFTCYSYQLISSHE